MTNLQNFQLLDHFILRVPEIDGDHRIMLDLIKAVLSAAGTRNETRCAQYMDRLFAFAQSHFKREECLLEAWQFPDLESHVAYHAELMSRAETMREDCSNLESHEEFIACCEKMMSFLVDDVVRGDLKLKSFVEREGHALPG